MVRPFKPTASARKRKVSPNPNPTPTPAVPSFVENFDPGTGSGAISHGWGWEDQENPGDGTWLCRGSVNGCGILNPVSATYENDGTLGFGNGLFEVRAKFTSSTGNVGSGSGPAIVLWPVSDVWPGPEIDIGELNYAGEFYMATHWKVENGTPQGADGYTAYVAPAGHTWWEWHTYAAYLQTGKITYYIDGVILGIETAHPAPGFAVGGQNHTIGIMNRSAETTARADWMRWTSEAEIIRAGTIITVPPPVVPPIPPIQGRTISISPVNPGSRAAGPWPVTVTTTSITSISWVMMEPNTWAWRGNAVTVATTGSVGIVPNLDVTGDFLKVWDTNDVGLAAYSGNVTITGGTTPPGPTPVTPVPQVDAMDLVGPGGGTPGAFSIVVQGQSNAYFWFEDEGYSPSFEWFLPALRALTGLGSLLNLEGQPTGYADGGSYEGGTSTFGIPSGWESWLLPDAAGAQVGNAATWGDGFHMAQMKKFMSTRQNQIAANRPWAMIRMHSEYDTTLTDSEMQYYAAANRELINRWRSSMGGRAASLLPVFYVAPSFLMNVKDFALRKVREDWRADTRIAARNSYFGVGSTLDGDDRDNSTVSHATADSYRRVAMRMAIRMARWMFENGYSNNDLSWLPTHGPRIIAVNRVSGFNNQLDWKIGHQKGTDIIVPADPKLNAFSVIDNGVYREPTALVRQSADTLRLTFGVGLNQTNANVLCDYGLWTGFDSAARQITDNWHDAAVTKPALYGTTPNLAGVRMILARMTAPMLVT